MLATSAVGIGAPAWAEETQSAGRSDVAEAALPPAEAAAVPASASGAAIAQLSPVPAEPLSPEAESSPEFTPELDLESESEPENGSVPAEFDMPSAESDVPPNGFEDGGAPLREPLPSELAPPEAAPRQQASPDDSAPTAEEPEPRVLVAEVMIEGVEGTAQASLLEDEIYGAIQTQPGQGTTSSQLQADLNSIFGTGYFANVNFRPEDTPLGVRVVFIVEPNPVLRRVTAPETQILTAEKIDEIFAPQYDKILNFRDLQAGVKQVNDFYQEQGYVLAQVVDATQVTPDGQVDLVIAEGIVDRVEVRFLDADGNPTNDAGEVVQGRTKPYIVTREFSLKEGDVFNRQQAEADLQRVFGLGLFQDVRLSLDPSPDDPRRVIVVANVIESRTGNVGATGGISSSNGLFGSISLGQDNFRGRNQKLRSEVTLGQRDFLFDVGFTDPWIKGDPYRTGYTVNAFRRRSQSLIFSGGDTDIDLPNGDTPRILRLGGGVRFSRPLSTNVFEPAEWNASAGLQYQRVIIRDEDGDAEPQDELGNDLTFSGDDADDLILLQMGVARDRRNNRAQPTQGSITRLNVDQSLPFGSGSIFLNRLRANHSQYLPVRFLKFTEGCKKEDASSSECPQTLAFNVQAGTILGDLPPYEAFSLGGANSVRGYGEGEVGSGRSFLQATAEYRFPVFSIVGGALFADFGTDLGTGDNVPGNPAGVRDKPGSGYGVGLGVRVQSPLGAIRADYTVLTDDGDQRFQFGIGERF